MKNTDVNDEFKDATDTNKKLAIELTALKITVATLIGTVNKLTNGSFITALNEAVASSEKEYGDNEIVLSALSKIKSMQP